MCGCRLGATVVSSHGDNFGLLCPKYKALKMSNIPTFKILCSNKIVSMKTVDSVLDYPESQRHNLENEAVISFT